MLDIKRDGWTVDQLNELIDQLLAAESWCVNRCPYVYQFFMFPRLSMWDKIMSTFVIIKDLWWRR